MNTLAFIDTQTSGYTAGQREQVKACALTADRLFNEIVTLDELTRFRPAWDDLVTRALEPNAFIEPGFAIPLFQHCGNKKKLRFLLAWEAAGADPRHRLLGLMPFALPNVLSLFARAASHDYAPLGTPLFDREQGLEALGAMTGLLRRRHPGVCGLMLPQLPSQGPVVALLRRHAELNQNRLHLFNEYERAALSKASGSAGQISAKRRKQYRQQRRRLSESGEVTYRTARDPAQIRQATESFLSLEFKGWKGLRKTALLASGSSATFFRAMTRSMALEGKCRIDTLDIDGTPVAIGVLLESSGRAFYWKTTYDERLAALSPGVQLTLDLTQTQLANPAVALTDSCAIANHPMIDHIWKDRIAMADVLLPTGSPRALFFKLGLWREMLRQDLRRAVKPALKRLLRRGR